MAENKKSFIAYSDWYEMFKALPDDVAGKLIKHIFSYVNDENPNTDDFIINALFAQVKSTLKRDLVKWEEQRQQRSEAGKKSAEIRSTKINERSTSVNETERNSTVSVSVNVSDNVNDNVIIKEEVKSDKPITHTSKFIIPTIDEIKEYCLERNNRVDATKFYNFYESKGWLIGKNKMKDWKAAVRNWEASDNKSLKPAAYNNEREIKQF